MSGYSTPNTTAAPPTTPRTPVARRNSNCLTINTDPEKKSIIKDCFKLKDQRDEIDHDIFLLCFNLTALDKTRCKLQKSRSFSFSPDRVIPYKAKAPSTPKAKVSE